MEFQIVRPDGEIRWVLNRGFQIHDAEGRVVRITGVATDITERKLAEAELQKTHKVLLETSRRAGMAEVATAVLHNVGNVLNSVNVSSSCVTDNLKKSKVAKLSKVVKLLGQHQGDLSHFLTNDPQGRQLPLYLAQLAAHLAGEQQSAIKELGNLQSNIEHIKDIVSMQQSLARVFGLVESLQVADLVEDALKMNADSLTRHGVEVIRDFEEVPNVTVEKHKVLQILVNLISNARQACDELDPPEKRLIVRIATRDRNVRIALVDNGIGIPRQNLTRVFAYGFTTKESGHGFGLHSGALAAKELGGSLEAASDGPGLGATFVLELPGAVAKP
jgi:C4-dicarboxylate-specific signal transduction histidine kinase